MWEGRFYGRIIDKCRGFNFLIGFVSVGENLIYEDLSCVINIQQVTMASTQAITYDIE